MALRVAGLPALIGAVTPGRRTKSLSGRTGSVILSVIWISLLDRDASEGSRSRTHENQITEASIPGPACWSLMVPHLAQKEKTRASKTDKDRLNVVGTQE